MDRLRTGGLGGGDDLVDDEVGLVRGSRAEVHGDIGCQGVGGLGVGIGVHGDGADAQAPARADDAQGDLAAVGDEDCVEELHGHHILKTP